MAFIYSWVPAYKEIVTKLQDYRDRQTELIQLLIDAGVNVHDDEAVRGTKTPLREIDPFTFLFFLGKANNYANWVRVLRKLCSIWNIQVKVNDVCGLPTTNAQKLWMFPYEHDRTTEINDLWEFFFCALNNTITDGQFAKILAINSVGLQKITEGLFMVDPQKYLCLNAKVKPYLETQGINTYFSNYTELMQVYKAVRNKFSLPFHEISFKAYISEITKDYVPSYFRIGTKDGSGGESQLKDMITNNVVSIGWSELGDLLEINPFNKSRIQQAIINKWPKYDKGTATRKAGEIVRFVQEIKAGDYVLAADGASIKAIGKVISDHYVYEPELNFSHCRCVDWLFKSTAGFSVDEGLMTTVWKYAYKEGIRDIENYLSQATEKKRKFDQEKTLSILKNMALNRILFGPPGTGKTFHSISHAVAIVEGKEIKDIIKEREQEVKDRKIEGTIKARFDKYTEDKKIVFCTFHQSMSYEDFIEGIKPIEPRVDDTYLKYETRSGILKELCENIKSRERLVTNTLSIAPDISDFNKLYTAFLKKISDILSALSEDKNYRIPSRRSEVTILKVENDNIITRGRNASQDEAVEKEKVKMIYDTFGSPAEISDVNNDIRRLDTGMSWTTNYYAVFRALKEFEDSIRNFTKNKTESTTKNYVLIIDEINRGNVSQIFGELITLIEEDKRLGNVEGLTVTLPYSKDEFGVPPNLYIIGTMNTADRSVEALDTALRRRFTFVPMMPDEAKLSKTEDGIDLSALLKTLNERLKILKDSDHTIGHAWLMGVGNLDGLKKVFTNKILPLLQEYFYNDYEKLGMLLGEKFFKKPTTVEDKSFAKFFGSSLSSQYENAEQYQLEDVDKLTKDVFVSIYQ